MYAEIIAIGSELTCGSKLDTNSQWLSREVESLGWTVTRHTTLADDLAAITAELEAASQRAQVVLITGGLGPTLDDITREAMAAAFRQPLIRDPDSVRLIEALFAARGRAMPERNLRQADRPEGSEVLPNSCGTAPGILMRVEAPSGSSCLLAVMPGVPAEMRPMFLQHVRPRLVGSGLKISRRVIRTFGYGESDAERLLGDLTARNRNPEVGITASEAVISLWVTARSKSTENSEQMCAETSQQICQLLGEAVYAEGDVELHEVVADLLKSRGDRLTLLEGAATGGLLSLWMTEHPNCASVIDRAEVFSRCLPSATSRPAADSPPGLQSLPIWEVAARELSSQCLQDANGPQWLLMSSPFCDDTAAAGVTIRRGLVAVAGSGLFETCDVSMSGNLKIFRQRAARTALNRLRLLLQHDPKQRSHSLPDQDR